MMKRIGKFMVYQPSTGYTMFEHESLDSAVKEAKRLWLIHNKPFEILEVVVRMEEKEIPVVKKELVIEFTDRFKKDELPF